MRTLLSDILLSLRTLRRAPAFLAVVVATLAIGVGATTAIASAVLGILLSDLPYPQADRIVSATAEQPAEGIQGVTFRVVEWDALRQARSLTAVGGSYPIGLTLSGTGIEAARLEAAMVTPGYFDVFGAEPMLGSVFTAEAATGDDRRVVLSHGFWARHLGQDPDVLGRTLRLDQIAFTIVGVLPSGFVPVDGAPELYIPHTVGTERWIGRWLSLYGRLAPAATLTTATAEADGILAALGANESRTSGYQARLVPLKSHLVGDTEMTLLALAGAVVLVLLVAAGNVANLSLVRALGKRYEVNVRLALGASRARIARLAAIDGLVIATLGAVGGIVLAAVLLQVLLALAPASIPRLGTVRLDPGVMLVSLAVAVVVALGFAVAPALWTWRGSSSAGLHRGVTVGTDGGRTLGGLVSAEIALAFVVLVGAGLLLRSFQSLLATDPGFRPASAVAFEIALPGASYATPEQRSAYFQQLVEDVAALPGVTAAAVGSNLPLGGRGSWLRARSEVGLLAGREEWPPALQRVAGEGFFGVLGVPVLEGRSFQPSDRALDQSVVVVNRTLATQLWSGRSPVGQRMTFRRTPGDDDWVEVIGVVGDVKYQELDAAAEPQVYEFHAQHAWGAMYLFARSDGAAEPVIDAVRAVVARTDPEVPIASVVPLDGIVSGAVAGPRFALALFTAFAVVALILAVAGVYGVLTYAVSRRRRDLGIMLALGARPGRVLGLVLRQGMVLLSLGIVVGAAGAVVGSRFLTFALYQVSPVDTRTYTIAVLVIALVVMLACLAPSLRASRVEPAEVLRAE